LRIALVGVLAGLAGTASAVQEAAAPPAAPAAAPPARPRGLLRRENGALPGYTLIAPLNTKTIRLVDLDGKVVHQWKTGFEPGSEIFLDNGNLLRCSNEPNAPRFNAGGQCGRLQEIAWDGSVVWDWKYVSDEHLQHHDLAVTPDGTILFIAWEYKSKADAVAAGRHPAHVGMNGMWSESIIEVEPVRPDGAEVIWEWHVWDHLVQDLDPDAANHGNVGQHPELLDVNADLRRAPPSDAAVEEMKALGYIDAKPDRGELQADWLHLNAIDYEPDLDQIVVSSPHLNEVWIIDHSTTSDEAASHEGGIAGHGGDFLWRWGNPKDYGAGTPADRALFSQHDVRWIPQGQPGAGHLTVFNNGPERPQGDYSTVLELATPLKPDRTYGLEPFVAAGPASPIWTYQAKEPKEFFSSFISGAQRLRNGSTLICEGRTGRVFEVTAAGEIVWEYLQPFEPESPPKGPPDMNYALFRATRIPLDHPGLAGKELRPLE